MKCIQLKLAVLAISAAAVLPTTSQAGPLALRNCTWCHGANAQGYTPAPRLAGQHARYIENQLESFHRHVRNGPSAKLYMWGAAGNLSRWRIRKLATYFASLRPRAADDGDKTRVAEGRKIFQLGLPSSNIVACVACHGPRAQGTGRIPRLGGLAYSYLKSRLVQWKEGYHGALARPMPDIARRLNRKEVAALASYLSFLK